MGEKVKMVQESIFAVGSSKRADRALHGRRPHEGAGYAAGDIGRFPNPVSVKDPPCSLESHLTSCVPFPRTSFAFSSSFCRPVLHRQGCGTMDALTPLPTGLPACRWPHRFGLRRFAPTLGLGPALASLFTRSASPGNFSHRPGRGLLSSPALLPNRAIRHNPGTSTTVL